MLHAAGLERPSPPQAVNRTVDVQPIHQQPAERRVEPGLVGRKRDRRLQRRERIVQIRSVPRAARVLIPVPVVNPEVVLRLWRLWQARDHQPEQSDCAIVIAERGGRGAQPIPGFDEVGP